MIFFDLRCGESDPNNPQLLPHGKILTIKLYNDSKKPICDRFNFFMLECQNFVYGVIDPEQTPRGKIFRIRSLSLTLGALSWSKNGYL